MAYRTTLRRGEAVDVGGQELTFVGVDAWGYDVFELNDGTTLELEPYDKHALGPDILVWTTPGDRGQQQTNVNVDAPSDVPITKEQP